MVNWIAIVQSDARLRAAGRSLCVSNEAPTDAARRDDSRTAAPPGAGIGGACRGQGPAGSRRRLTSRATATRGRPPAAAHPLGAGRAGAARDRAGGGGGSLHPAGAEVLIGP